MSTARTLAFVGSMTEPCPYVAQSHGSGITVFDYDPQTGALRELSRTGGITNPSFLSLHPRLPVLYATSEVYGWNEGTVSAYRIDVATGKLTYLNKQPTLGSVAAQSSLDAEGRRLFVVNYRMGELDDLPGQSVAVFQVREDGSLAPASASAAHSGSGPKAERQEGPHPHCVLVSPDGRHAVATDLGTDEVVVYAIHDGGLARVSELKLRPGTGPRHMAWHPGGRVLYVNGELDQTVSALDWNSGTLRHLHTAATLPEEFAGVNHTADLHVSPDGRFVYCSNRGHDSIAVFATSADGSALRPLGQVPTGGATPRSFCLDPAGRFLIAANQDSDTLAVFRRDMQTGALTRVGDLIEAGTPMCVRLRTFDGAG